MDPIRSLSFSGALADRTRQERPTEHRRHLLLAEDMASRTDTVANAGHYWPRYRRLACGGDAAGLWPIQELPRGALTQVMNQLYD